MYRAFWLELERIAKAWKNRREKSHGKKRILQSSEIRKGSPCLRGY